MARCHGCGQDDGITHACVTKLPPFYSHEDYVKLETKCNLYRETLEEIDRLYRSFIPSPTVEAETRIKALVKSVLGSLRR